MVEKEVWSFNNAIQRTSTRLITSPASKVSKNLKGYPLESHAVLKSQFKISFDLFLIPEQVNKFQLLLIYSEQMVSENLASNVAS